MNYIFSSQRSVLFRIVIFLFILIALPFTVFLALQQQNLPGQAVDLQSNLIFLEKPRVFIPGQPIRVGLKAPEANDSWIGLYLLEAVNTNYLRRKNLTECPLSTNLSNVRICNFNTPIRSGLYEFRLFSQNNTRLADSQTIKVAGYQNPTIIPSGIKPTISIYPSIYPKPSCNPWPTCPSGSICPKFPIDNSGNWCLPTIYPKPSCVIAPPCVYTEPYCGGIAPPEGGWCPLTPTPQYCLQVFTWGRSKLTGECKLYPTSCLPDGWVADKSCAITPTRFPTRYICPTPPVCNGKLIYGDPAPNDPNQCPRYSCI